MIAIIDYGLGNLANVKNAFDMIGVEALITNDKKLIETADHLVFPGVGAAGAGMNRLKITGLDKLIAGEVKKGKPILGICLGMQLLFEKSAEGGVDCLGLIRGEVKKFVNQNLKIPHIGWNSVTIGDSIIFEGVAEKNHFYFVHSFYCQPEDATATIGKTDYGVVFCSAVSQNNIFGVQFHPEKSGEAGLLLLKNFSKI